MKELQNQTSDEKIESKSNDEVATVTEELESIDIKEKRVSKAQKRRDKKTEKEKERLEDIARYLHDLNLLLLTVGYRILKEKVTLLVAAEVAQYRVRNS